jgi:hypothetical protein
MGVQPVHRWAPLLTEKTGRRNQKAFGALASGHTCHPSMTAFVATLPTVKIFV